MTFFSTSGSSPGEPTASPDAVQKRKLTNAEILQIRSLRKFNRTKHRDLAIAFGVPITTIAAVLRWRYTVKPHIKPTRADFYGEKRR